MNTNTSLLNRRPIASGRFFSNHADKLEIEIANMIQEAREKTNFKLNKHDDLLALIAPHAGYIFSGVVAASAFMQLEKLTPRKKVFIIGSSHHTSFDGASIYNKGHYLTPFGKVKVDLKLSNKIIANSEIIKYKEEAHTLEHSIEVLLPFIQYFWGNKFEIVPIIVATDSIDTCKQLANELTPYFNSNNLFLVSTDLSHYASYYNAKKVDKLTVKALSSGDPQKLLKQIKQNYLKDIPNLSTSMCGWTSTLTLLYLLENRVEKSINPILYQNSGDVRTYGDNKKVVGYQSFAITATKKEKLIKLSSRDKKQLLTTASLAINNYLSNNSDKEFKHPHHSENLETPTGAFVSIYVNGELNGCIGQLQNHKTPLVKLVADMAVSAAFKDNRFVPITSEDLKAITIEISVLSPLEKIENIDRIELGKHGIFIKKDYHAGTFLPQVANKMNWSVEEFVSNCSKNKAGLGKDGWKSADIFIYEATVFKS